MIGLRICWINLDTQGHDPNLSLGIDGMINFDSSKNWIKLLNESLINYENMKGVLCYILLLPLGCIAQGPFFYWEYQVNPIVVNQISWDTNNPDNEIWQYGQNQKPFFGAIDDIILVTDTTNMYDSLIDAWVDVVLTRPYEGQYVEEGTAYVLKFDHKIDTDTSHAGGYFEINIDNDSLTYIKDGNSLKTYWLKFFLNSGNSANDLGFPLFGNSYQIIADNGDTIQMPGQYWWHNFYHNINGYHDTLFDNIVGFTGSYQDWQSFYMEMFFFQGGVKVADQEDSLIFRFHFKSDSISNNKNGWAIKNIESGYAVHPTGSLDENGKNYFSVFPNPTVDFVYFSKNQHTPLLNIRVNLYNSQGEVIESKNENSNFHMDISHYPPGIYFYTISDADTKLMQTGKLVKY